MLDSTNQSVKIDASIPSTKEESILVLLGNEIVNIRNLKNVWACVNNQYDSYHNGYYEIHLTYTDGNNEVIVYFHEVEKGRTIYKNFKEFLKTRTLVNFE